VLQFYSNTLFFFEVNSRVSASNDFEFFILLNFKSPFDVFDCDNIYLILYSLYVTKKAIMNTLRKEKN